MEVLIDEGKQKAVLERLNAKRRPYNRFCDWAYAVLRNEEEYDKDIARLAMVLIKHELPTIQATVALNASIGKQLSQAAERLRKHRLGIEKGEPEGPPLIGLRRRI